MQYTEERIGKILQELSGLRYPQNIKAGSWKMKKISSGVRPEDILKSAAEPEDDTWEDISEGEIWGGHNEYYAFIGDIVIPEDFQGKPAELLFTTGKEGEWDAANPQFLAFVDGNLVQGLDVNHRTLRLSESAEAGRRYAVFLSAFTGVRNYHLLFDVCLRTVDEKVNGLYYDLLIPWQTACLLDKTDTAYIRYMEQLNQVVNLLDLRKPGSASFESSVQAAQEYLKSLYYTKPGRAEAVISCIGHTHIDVAWLWTLSVTRDKAVRSFSTVLELMRRYPEYKFMSSQPQLYMFLKEQAPAVYEEVRQRISEGRWEAEGGMFLEADCNLTSGEALVRQFVYGKRFFREEFGKDSHILWLPDVFGYSAALPQIMKKCGIRYFMTTKISWNDTNRIPFDTFRWKGIDGTKILTHFVSTQDYRSGSRLHKTSNEFTGQFATTYNGYINPSQMKGAWQRFQQKELQDEILCSFGYGDGGGGPTEEMLETQRRLSFALPGCPATKIDTAGNFFRRLEKNLEDKEVPVWAGELYLEFHRGTYTSMARNKRYNRKAELALTDLETGSLMADRLAGVPYDQNFMEEQWRTVLLNQFHDILPGSAIEEVYTESKQQYEALFEAVEEKMKTAGQAIASSAGTDLIFNPNGQKMDGYVALPRETAVRNRYPDAQKLYDGQYLIRAEQVPSKGFISAEKSISRSDNGHVKAFISEGEFENPLIRIQFNKKGQIVSWYDKRAKREILQPGTAGNVLMTYEDKPFIYDNWNIEEYSRQKSWPVEDLREAEVLEEGPCRYGLRFLYRYLDSDIEEKLFFYAGSSRMDMDIRVDWKETDILLKVLFPVEINTTEAVFDIQYGNVKRPTTTNTSWDQARFEVCHQKWMDISEGNYGVSFLNDCKYGVSIRENVAGLTILKAGTYPNPAADKEVHQMKYSVIPHTGTWKESRIVQEAYLFNDPLVFVPCPERSEKGDAGSSCGLQEFPHSYSSASCTASNVMIEVVKKADRCAGTVIRLYEFENTRTEAYLLLPEKCRKIWLTDMLEDKQCLLAENTDVVHLHFRPYEIVTLLAEIDGFQGHGKEV